MGDHQEIASFWLSFLEEGSLVAKSGNWLPIVPSMAHEVRFVFAVHWFT
jgi:hypothetical protein